MNPTAMATAVGSGWVRMTRNSWVRATALFLYYLGIIIALLLIYGRGDFKAAPFVYQGF